VTIRPSIRTFHLRNNTFRLNLMWKSILMTHALSIKFKYNLIMRRNILMAVTINISSFYNFSSLRPFSFLNFFPFRLWCLLFLRLLSLLLPLRPRSKFTLQQPD
jgi:hypothetical protein